MRLPIKIALYMIGIIAFAVVLLTYLTNAKFRALQEEVERSRFLVLANDVKATAERGLALGLGIEQMANLSGILERLDSEHPDILSLRILNDRGEALYSTGALPEGAEPGAPSVADPGRRDGVTAPAAPPSLAAPANAAAPGLMLPLVNAFGQPAGAVVLQYDRTSSAQAAHRVTLAQLRVTGLTLLVAALTAMAVTGLYLSGLTRSFTGMTRRLQQSEEAAEPAPADDLEQRLRRVMMQIRKLDEKVTQAEGALAKR